MAIGLTDLNKKRITTGTSSLKKEAPQAPTPKSLARETIAPVQQKSSNGLSATKSFRSKTARPWSQSTLQPTTRNRKRETTSDIVMNDDWASIHVMPVFWLDAVDGSKLLLLQEKLSELEERVHNGICGPWRALLRFCS